MKTTIEYKGGQAANPTRAAIEEFPDAMPSFSADEMDLYLIDTESSVLTDPIPIDAIRRVIFEND